MEGNRMAEKRLDKIHIRDLALRCILGINEEERREKNDVLINITLHADLWTACLTDSIEDTVDYRALKKRIIELVEGSSSHLVEHLAERVAALCLEDPRGKRVKICIDKPGALRFARSVGIELIRERDTG
jgi:FolB domain-containing protein